MNYITFDIETYSPSNSKRIDTNEFRVTVVGAYFSWIDKYIAFLEDEVKDFLDVLKEAELVVGFNHIWFDLPVLQKYSTYNLFQLTNYDIMVEFEKKAGFKAKLDDLAKSNLGAKKTDTYESYSKYHEQCKWSELIDYCMNDVKLTEDLFKIIRGGGELLYDDSLQVKEFVLNQPVGKKVTLEAQPDSIF
ncbi:MAG: ribonuclease H-like domain-containing protein [Patescibacteria group bacterium]